MSSAAQTATWTIDVLAAEDAASTDAVMQLLRAYNAQFIGRPPFAPFRLVVRNAQQRPVGGLLGEFRGHWLHVDILVVDAALRGQGVGRALLVAAEQAARQQNCHGIWLDTFDFQAPAFYESQGFTRFGTIENFHDGHARHFYLKRFAT